MTLGLVLSGGGARGAYQAGVLKAVAEIASALGIPHPFPIVTGVSAGALNAAFLSVYADQVNAAAHRLCELWSKVRTQDVFRTDPISLSRIGMSWATDLLGGGRAKKIQALLDTQPLSRLLSQNLDLSRIQKNIDASALQALAITATDYATSLSITFVQGKAGLKPWQRSRRTSVMEDITIGHIMASSAIPLLFPAIKLGERYYGDGCLRNMAPLSPAIRLGSTKLLVVGVRRDTSASDIPRPGSIGASAGRVLSVLINSVMLDGTENDLESLTRTNATLASQPVASYDGRELKKIDFLCIKPSEDLATVALNHVQSMPPLVKYLVRGLGPLEQAAELISYILFEPAYCNELLALGYADGMRQRGSIEALLQL